MKSQLTVFFVYSCLASHGVFGQDCDPSQHTANECFNIISQRISKQQDNFAEFKEVSQQEIRNARRDLRIATTGDVPINVLGSPVSLNDLLPVLNIAVEPGTAGDSQSSSSIAIEYSPIRKILGGDLKASLLAKSPELADPVEEAIDDQATTDQLESGLDYSDDVTISLTYSYLGRIGGLQIGRSDSFYADLMDGMLAAATSQAPSVINNLIGATLNALIRAYPDPWRADITAVMRAQPYGKLKEKLEEANKAIFANTASRDQFINSLQGLTAITNSPMADTFSNCESTLGQVLIASPSEIDALATEYADCIYSGFVDKLETSVTASLTRTAKYNKFLTDNGFFKLGGLINNQPQLLFTGTAQYRDAFAGGDNFSAKLSYEFDLSIQNINTLNDYLLRNSCSKGVGKSELTVAIYSNCATKIGEYIANNPVQEGGWRGSLSIEYKERNDISLDLPISMVPFSVEGGESFVASFVAGRQFQMLDHSGLPKGKLDIGISYDNVSDDPMRQDRAFGTVTFTQQLAPATQFTVGLVWANKAEFRGEVDEEFSAKIGLNYKFAGIGSIE